MLRSTPGRSVAIALCLAAAATAALAADIDVNSTTDQQDADTGDGVCDADTGTAGLQCTLRAAVQHANASPGLDLIRLPAGTYELSIRGRGRPAQRGDLDITDAVRIEGAGPLATTIDAQRAKDRIFDVETPVQVEIVGLTLTHGRVRGGQTGGGLRVDSGVVIVEDVMVTDCRAGHHGGAVDVLGGDVTLRRVWANGNACGDSGGAVHIDGGTLLIESSALTNNRAASRGGGFSNGGVPASTLLNTTVSGNTARDGGGISVSFGSTTDVVHCTVTANGTRRPGRGGGISTRIGTFIGPNVARLTGTIVAGNTSESCVGGVQSLGGNIDDGTTCAFGGGVGDRSSTDPLLGPLTTVAGVTAVHPLLPGSPAVGLGSPPCPATDQLGNPRGAPCDAGAVNGN